MNTLNHEMRLTRILLYFRVMVATTFIVFGNVFLVSFGNHQSPGMSYLIHYLCCMFPYRLVLQ